MIILISAYYTSQIKKKISEIDFKDKFNRSSLFHISMKYHTDKIYIHYYETLYEKYPSHYQDTSIRLLEIGPSCDRGQCIGASAQTWREYLGHKADIHFLEINEKCGKDWEATVGKQVRSKVIII